MYKVAYLTLILQAFVLTSANASDVVLNVKSRSSTRMISNELHIQLELSKSVNEGIMTFKVVRTRMEMWQNVDPKFKDKVDIDEYINATSGDKILSDIDGKAIKYRHSENNDKWILLEDQTNDNTFLGPISGILDISILYKSNLENNSFPSAFFNPKDMKHLKTETGEFPVDLICFPSQDEDSDSKSHVITNYAAWESKDKFPKFCKIHTEHRMKDNSTIFSITLVNQEGQDEIDWETRLSAMINKHTGNTVSEDRELFRKGEF